jgi:hypothetical protein
VRGLPLEVRYLYEAQIELMRQRGGLEGVALLFVLQVPAGHQAQFGIDVLRQVAKRRLVSATPAFQSTGDFCRTSVDGYPFSPRRKKYTRNVWTLLPSASAFTGESG